jgi:hypothetical protein
MFPITVREFRTVAEETVRSPLILAAFKTLRDEIVVVAPAADNVVPPTVKLFWMVAAEAVRSPLIVTLFETWRDEIVVIAAPAEIFPTTVRLF